VSTPATIRRVSCIVAMLLVAGTAAGCGYKGPLYLPPASGQDDAAPARPPSLPGDDSLSNDDFSLN